MTERPPILVTQGHQRGGRALIQNLLEAGHPLVTTSPFRRLGRRHEALIHETILAAPFEEPADYTSSVCAAAKKHAVAAVIASDDDLLVLSRHRQGLEPEVRLLAPPFSHLIRLVDRRRLAEHARLAGVATPRALEVRDLAEVSDAARRLGLPLRIRPRFGRGDEGVFVFERDSDLAKHETELSTLLSENRFIAENDVPGTLIEVFGLVAKRRLEALASHAVVRRAPRHGARVAARRTVREVGVESTAARLFERLGIEGVIGLELRWMPEDGRLWLLDIAPGFGDGAAAAIASGVDLAALYLDFAGRREPRAREQTPYRGVESRWWPAELAYLVERILEGRWREAMGVFRRTGNSSVFERGGVGASDVLWKALKSGGASAIGLDCKVAPLTSRVRWLEGELAAQSSMTAAGGSVEA